MKKRLLLLIAFLPMALAYQILLAKPNCNIYKFNKDKACYKGCQTAMQAIQYSQGSRASQLLFDRSIGQCPTLDYAYFEKAVPYLKRGQFIEWKKMIDQAVELNPTQHLGYRGWCRFQFLKDAEGAIKDIEQLDDMVSYEIGYSQNGDYHLKVALALCYKTLGQPQKALSILKKQIDQEDYNPGLYDYLHLGVLYLELNQPELAIQALQTELEQNDYLADTYFYLAKAYQELGLLDQALQNLNKAFDWYERGYVRFDAYVEPVDKVFLADLEEMERMIGGVL